MIDHITFGVSDLLRSTQFYDRAFGPLNMRRLVNLSSDETGDVAVCGYGSNQPYFWLVEERQTTGVFHVALTAKSRAEVDAFHLAALQAGGTDNGAPGLRKHYHSNYYGAFVLDPDGQNIEAVFHGEP